MKIEKAKIYGVDGVGKEDASLTRTDSAVGKNYVLGASEIYSDFNNCYPWSDMHKITDAFGNVFVKIPKFYSKKTYNADGSYKLQISGVRYDGFSTLFVDGKGNELDYVLYGSYEASGSKQKAESKSGKSTLVNITLPEMRSACMANGRGYQQLDFLIDEILFELIVIEFATTNSQSIGRGYVDGNSAAIATGRTDSVKTPSGSEVSRTDGKHAFKYRGIENPWGNIWKWVDGITFSDEKVYICLDPEAYVSEKTAQPYEYVGDRPLDSGYIKVVKGFENFPLLGYISELGGAENKYYCDYSWSEGTVLLVGGDWGHGSAAGVRYWDGVCDASRSGSNVGGRLCYKPLPERD